ncbi:YitT family protein [Macrococcus sp. DPC7161]|uniref:YczE/YyaS/YitT family protein n=1 Tax=Macrococcus sp. DPC7161 TaxID=2507060 RepID=UPI00100B73BF|nr:YitT family protein [Macrococcus sp. DPC7161]RXK17307.1 YitT family protein [Macrococcus sp. DPC7161]
MYIGHYKVRWLFFMTGLAIIGLGIALMLRGRQFGLSSWDVLHYGLQKQLGLTIGLWSIIMGILIVLVTVIFDRRWPKTGVYINMLMIGTFTDIFNYLLPNITGLMPQIIVYSIGFLVLSFGIAFYITPELGAGPRDTFMLLLIERTPMDLKTARTLMEVIVLIIGYLLGGPVGIGTIVVTLSLGTCIQMWLPFTRKILSLLGVNRKEIERL